MIMKSKCLDLETSDKKETSDENNGVSLKTAIRMHTNFSIQKPVIRIKETGDNNKSVTKCLDLGTREEEKETRVKNKGVSQIAAIRRKISQFRNQ